MANKPIVRNTLVGTPYVIRDRGEGKSPRFELFNTKEMKIVKKDDNPYIFYDFVWKKG